MKTYACQFYVSDKSRNFFLTQDKKLTIKTGMKMKTVDNGFIAVNPKTGAYGVLDARGRFVKSSKCLRDNNGQFKPKIARNATVPYYDCDAVFCGSCVGHFGHFLLEGMNRLYPATRAKYRNAKFVFCKNRAGDVPGYIVPLVAGLGIKPENIIFLDSVAQFRHVFVPEQSLNIPRWSSVQFGEIYRTISDFYSQTSSVPHHDKIYVSRGALNARRTFGEKHLEEIFAKNGFKVICPETLSLATQIAIMSHCHTLAGAAGTALHLSLFMPSGSTVIQIKRNSQVKDNVGNQNMICKTLGQQLIYISASTEERPTPHFTECPQILGMTDEMCQFMRDFDFQLSATDIAGSDETEIAAYRAALAEYERASGSVIAVKIKKKFVKYISCLVPGRINRGNFRRWLQRKLGLKK